MGLLADLFGIFILRFSAIVASPAAAGFAARDGGAGGFSVASSECGRVVGRPRSMQLADPAPHAYILQYALFKISWTMFCVPLTTAVFHSIDVDVVSPAHHV